MADRPILFSGAMVRALLAGTKTQTRRVLKGIEQTDSGDWHIFGNGGGAWGVKEEFVPRFAPDYAPYAIGDRLWVREAWNITFTSELAPGEVIERTYDECVAANRGFACPVGHGLAYKATGVQRHPQYGKAVWRSPLHLPRYGSRITLTVTEVRVQRLQDISEADALAEGIELGRGNTTSPNHVFAYQCLWDDLNAKRGFGWDENPWVVAVSFSVHKGNIDAISEAA